MKIVMAPVNISGQPITLVKELRRIGLDISLVQYTGRGTAHKFGYESDRIVQYTGADRDEVQLQTVENLLREGTSIFHFWLRSLFFSGVYEGFTGLDIPIIRSYGRHIVYRFTGEDLRVRSLHIKRNPHNAYQYGYKTAIDEDRQQTYIAFLKENVDRFIVQDPEMHEFCPEATIVPRVIDLADFPFVGGGSNHRPLIVHAPTSPLVKGTRFVRNAVAELKSEGLAFEYQEISGLAHEQALDAYRRADIIVDQLHIGWYGVLAIEGMALGKAVICYVRPEFLESHQPKIPLIAANPLNIKEVLRQALKDAEWRQELGTAARRYVEEVHDVQRVAPQLAAIYRGLPEKTILQPETYATLEYFRSQCRHERDKNNGLMRKARAYDRLHAGEGEPARARRAPGLGQGDLVPSVTAAPPQLRRLSAAAGRQQDRASIFAGDSAVLELGRTRALPVAAKCEPRPPREVEGVVLLGCPWPYRGMLAICNDIDGATAENFARLHRFLNTREDTPLGPGLGLDIADSFWFYAPAAASRNPADRQMSVFAGLDWEQRSPDAERIFGYIRAGWIDTLHSYGDFPAAGDGGASFTREHAQRALAVLAEQKLTIGVWVNHGGQDNIQNIGTADYMVGDVPSSVQRHSDLLFQHGVRFLWPGEISGEFRQDVPASPITLQDGRRAWRFARHDFAYREDARDLAARLGAVIGTHAERPIALVWEPRLLHLQLSADNLAELSRKGGYAILGQHFGASPPGELLPPEAIEALQRLRAAQDAGEILVARTSRLLEYAGVREHLLFTAATDPSGTTVIDITGIDDPVRGLQPPVMNRLRGVTFAVPREGPVELCLGGRPITGRIPREILDVRLPGKRMIGIKWFAPDYIDYSRDAAAPGAGRDLQQPARRAPAVAAARRSRPTTAGRWRRFWH